MCPCLLLVFKVLAFMSIEVVGYITWHVLINRPET
jgi:hypothetical protein